MVAGLARSYRGYYSVNITDSARSNSISPVFRNANEAVTTRIDVLTTVFDKYLWFKMTDQVTTMGQVILSALENLIYVDLNSLNEEEFLTKHAVMKQSAVKSIFEQFLSDHSIDSSIADHCYKIIQTVRIGKRCLTSTTKARQTIIQRSFPFAVHSDCPAAVLIHLFVVV